MITIEDFDEKVIKRFFVSTAVIFLVLGFFSTIIQPAYAIDASLGLGIPLVGQNIIEGTVAWLTEVILPFIFVFFSLSIILNNVPILSNTDGGERLKRMMLVTLPLLVIGVHLLAVYERITPTFDVVYQIQHAVPGLVWFIATFFIVNLITGIFSKNPDEENILASLINKIFFVMAFFFIAWIILTPLQSSILKTIQARYDCSSLTLCTEQLVAGYLFNTIFLVILGIIVGLILLAITFKWTFKINLPSFGKNKRARKKALERLRQGGSEGDYI